MKTTLFSLVLAFLLTVPAPARADDHNRGGGFQAAGGAATAGDQTGGGYTGPGAAPMTVAEALKLGDEAWVSLTGRIDRQLGHENYQFRDDTGTVALEIDDDAWGGLTVGPNDVVVIHGEVDKDWTRFEIEVDRIAKK